VVECRWVKGRAGSAQRLSLPKPAQPEPAKCGLKPNVAWPAHQLAGVSSQLKPKQSRSCCNTIPTYQCSTQIHSTCFPLIWNSQVHHLRSRSPIHEQFCQSHMQIHRNTTEHQYRIPPLHRWTNQAHELMDRGLSPSVCHWMPGQLECPLTHSRVHAQFMEA
jgi:hypothetical protein